MRVRIFKRLLFLIGTTAHIHYAMESFSVTKATTPKYTKLLKLLNQNPFDEAAILNIIASLKAPYNVTEQQRTNLLCAAVATRAHPIVKQLLEVLPAEQGNSQSSLNAKTPLYTAVSLNLNSLVKLFLDHKPRISLGEFITTLHSALLNKNLVAARLLLQKIHCIPISSYSDESIQKLYITHPCLKLVISAPIAQRLILDGVSKGALANLSCLCTDLLPITLPAPANDSLNKLIFAFIQQDTYRFKNLLDSKPHHRFLLADNEQFFIHVHNLIFDRERVRSTLEEDSYLPQWHNSAALLITPGRTTARAMLTLFRRHLNIPKDIQWVLISFTIGQSLLTFLRSNHPKSAP